MLVRGAGGMVASTTQLGTATDEIRQWDPAPSAHHSASAPPPSPLERGRTGRQAKYACERWVARGELLWVSGGTTRRPQSCTWLAWLIRSAAYETPPTRSGAGADAGHPTSWCSRSGST